MKTSVGSAPLRAIAEHMEALGELAASVRKFVLLRCSYKTDMATGRLFMPDHCRTEADMEAVNERIRRLNEVTEAEHAVFRAMKAVDAQFAEEFFAMTPAGKAKRNCTEHVETQRSSLKDE